MEVFKRKAQWLMHPESPGMRVVVVRGFWGRLFKSGNLVTLSETIDYSLLSTEQKKGRK